MTGTIEGNITTLSASHDALNDVSIVISDGQGIEALRDISYGSLAGIIGKFIEYPFDTVKVRLQAQSEVLPLRYHGPLDCFRQSLRSEGFRGLYRGISAPLLGAAIETSSLFLSYRIAQEALHATVLSKKKDAPLPLGALVACGAASGAFTSLLLTPIELVKCQMQVPLNQSTTRPTTPLSIIVSTFRRHGLLGLWHGQLGTLIRETGGSAAWFGSYEGISTLFRTYNLQQPRTCLNEPSIQTLPIWQQLLAGASAGVSYNFIFYPADTVKSCMQTEETSMKLAGKRRTFGAVAKALWKQQGIKGLYRGCGITVARAAPSSAFIFAIYEGLRGHFG